MGTVARQWRAITLMKTEINFIFIGELIALFRYGLISIYGKLVIELGIEVFFFFLGDSNTEFKDVDFEGKKLTLKQKRWIKYDIFGILIKFWAHKISMYIVCPFLGIVKGLFQWPSSSILFLKLCK